MALPVRKSYKGAPASTTLSSGINNSATSFAVAAVTGWPTTFPFYAVIDPGTAKEEKIKVTGIASTTLTVVRGQDDTTAVTHDAAATVYPVFTALEADEANQIASVMTTKGDLIATDGSTINRLAIGATNTHVLQVDSTATNGFKWGQVATAGIADSAVTSAKIADGTIVDADVNASAAIALSKLATGALPTAITVASANIVDGTIATADLADGSVTSAKIADGTIVNADVNASAAIALSKLATGALPTAITVASANIVDGTIVAGDVASSLLKLVCPVGTITAYGGTSAPTGWLLCDGSSISGTYTELIALVGSTVPDLKGRVVVGLDSSQTEFDTRFETGGAKTVTLTAAQSGLPSHSHSITDPGHFHAFSKNNSAADFGTEFAAGALYGTASTQNTGDKTTGITVNSIAAAGASEAHTNLQPYMVLNYIIKHDY